MKLISLVLILLLSFSLQAQEACHQLFPNSDQVQSAPVKSQHRFVLPLEKRLNLPEFFSKLKEIESRKTPGVIFEKMGETSGLPVMMVTMTPAQNKNPQRLLITGGVHGSEVMGVKNAVYLFEKLLVNEKLREKFEITIVFNINNYGLKEGKRIAENEVDLNRSWSDKSTHPTSQLVLQSLNKKFTDRTGKIDLDLFIDLHDAYSRDKYFIIKSDAKENLLERTVELLPADIFIESKSGQYPEKFSSTFKVDAYELLAPGVSTSANEGTFKTYWYNKGIKNAYTFESPGQIDQKLNVETSSKILTTLLEQF